jgi:hypothetical protein
MPATPLRTFLVLGALAFASAGTGCFSDHSRNQDFDGAYGTDRFELVIEPDRTLVDGTHFLVDRATGDLWRLDVPDRTKGTWVRLATAPADAVELVPPPALDDDDANENDD